MKTSAITVACVGALAVSTLALARPAAAAPSGFGGLPAVELQGLPDIPLPQCPINRISYRGAPTVNSSAITNYVDVLCPNAE